MRKSTKMKKRTCPTSWKERGSIGAMLKHDKLKKYEVVLRSQQMVKKVTWAHSQTKMVQQGGKTGTTKEVHQENGTVD